MFEIFKISVLSHCSEYVFAHLKSFAQNSIQHDNNYPHHHWIYESL